MYSSGPTSRTGSFLPSRQFLLMAGSLLVSAGLIGGAWLVTFSRPQGGTATVGSVDGASDQTGDTAWQQQFASSSLQQQANTINTQAQTLLAAASSSNLTESVGKALLIKLAAAQGQGLGSDQPTQNSIVGGALSQIQNAQPLATPYSATDIVTVPQTSASLHTYGNVLMDTLNSHPQATYRATMVAVGLAVDNNDPTTLARLPGIATQYRTMAREVASLPTPGPLSGNAAQLANTFSQMADACGSMQLILSDPMKGLVGLQQYNALYTTSQQSFAQIAALLQKQGILFTQSESGATWAAFLAAWQAAQTQNNVPAASVQSR